jgi:hypothetical protein
MFCNEKVNFTVSLMTIEVQSPNLRTPNPGLNPGFNPTNAGGEHRVKPGVWRPEMWAQFTIS